MRSGEWLGARDEGDGGRCGASGVNLATRGCSGGWAMIGWLLLLSWVWPLLLAALAPRPRLWWLPGVGALPALLTALIVPLGTTLELPWLFLGTTLAMNPLTQVYLTFTSLLWLAAGVYAAFAQRGGEHAGRFNLLFLLAMSGNLWLIVGQDLFSFYVGFAMMGLSSYGLVIHDGRPAALRAGKVYLVMALFGEVCLFAALVLIASQTGTTLPSADDLAALDGLAIALLLLGLGVKAGMVPLHIWLPLAHPAAPIAASAVLSGTMIKTALLGWMRFLPVGAVALPEWGGLLAAAGTLTLLFALPIGLTQSDPKVVLAYSSISKMGLLMLVLGLALIEPALAPVAVAGIAFYAANHALVKGGLFLGVGMRKHAATRPPVVQALVLGALVFLALSLAGAPFTSGAVAKYELKPIFGALDWVWIGFVVGVSTFGTTLLMVRFVWVSYRTEPHPEPGYRWPGIAWGALIGLVLLLPFVFGKPSAWLTNLVEVPLALNLGLLALLFAVLRPRLLAPLVDRIPPGDILALFTPVQARAINWFRRADQRWQSAHTRLEQRAVDAFEHSLRHTERRHRTQSAAMAGRGRRLGRDQHLAAAVRAGGAAGGIQYRRCGSISAATGPGPEPVGAGGGDNPVSRRCRLGGKHDRPTAGTGPKHGNPRARRTGSAYRQTSRGNELARG